jgi:hypothetical protein
MKEASQNDDPGRYLLTKVQKSYFMQSQAERDVINIAFGKYCPVSRIRFFIGGIDRLSPALRQGTPKRQKFPGRAHKGRPDGVKITVSVFGSISTVRDKSAANGSLSSRKKSLLAIKQRYTKDFLTRDEP